MGVSTGLLGACDSPGRLLRVYQDLYPVRSELEWVPSLGWEGRRDSPG